MLLKNPKSILGFDDRKYVIAGVLLNTQTVMAIYYTGAFFKVKFIDYALSWFSEFLIIFILWFTIRSLYLQIAKRFNGYLNLRKRLSIMPFFIIPYVIICFFYLEYLQSFFKWEYTEFPEPTIPVQLVTGAIVLYANLGFYECILLVVELKNAKIREERMISENVTTQLMNLKNQISPHFLFNSLNTLVHLIDTDKEKSKEFVHRLAAIYQNTLEISELDLVALKDELEYIKAYTALLGERFGDSVLFEFEINQSFTDKKIVPLSLQMAIENAIKHNVITQKQPLKVNIKAEKDYLVIKNNLQKKINHHKNYGLGLSNIVKRYSFLTTKKVIIQNTEADFILKVPLLNQ